MQLRLMRLPGGRLALRLVALAATMLVVGPGAVPGSRILLAQTERVFEVAHPEDLGMSSARLEELGAAMNQMVADGTLPGLVVAIERRGELVFWQAAGWRDAQSRAPMKRTDVFRVNSMTKPLTATVALTLVQEGRLSLDDPVGRYLPQLASTHPESGEDTPMTIRHLLTNTSGFTYGFLDEWPVAEQYRQQRIMRPDRDLGQQIAALARLPLAFEPGTRWSYGVSMDVLGRVIEVIEGAGLDESMRRRVLDPLQMSETAFRLDSAELERLPRVHARGSAGWAPVDTPNDLLGARKVPLGGGGLYSTVRDYLRFCRMLHQRGELDGARLLADYTIDLMTRDHVPADWLPITLGPVALRGEGYGLGVGVVIDPEARGLPAARGSLLWAGANNTYFLVDPDNELTLLVMAQFQPFLGVPFAPRIERLTYAALK